MRIFVLCIAICCDLSVTCAAADETKIANDKVALVVVVSADQFAYEYLERFHAGFDPQGLFRRIEREGAWFTNCHHRHGVTTTAPGHSVQLTGAYPETNGIIDNAWLDRAFGHAQVYLREDHPALAGPSFARAQRLTRDWLLSKDPVAAAVTRNEILSGAVTGKLESALSRSFHPRRSGDVLYCLEPYDIPGGSAATHGSPWDYDTHVPLLAISFGNKELPNRIVHGRFRRKVSPACIAPTLAALLHVPPPGGCVEEALVEALPKNE